MKIKRLEVDLEIKSASDAGEIVGYGSVYGVEDKGGDIVAPGAFSKSLEALRGKGRSVPMLWQHDPGDPVGVWEEIKEDSRGLHMKGRALTDTTRGRDAVAFLKAKAISGLSIGFKTLVEDMDRKTGVRTIKEGELWEVSLVTFPMNDDARVMSVKADDVASMTEREIERALRDAGLSAREAKAVVSQCMNLGAQRDAAAIKEAALAEDKARRLLAAIRG